MDLLDFLAANGIDHREGGTHQHVRPGWVGVDCPRCGPRSGRFHAGVRNDLSRASCWRCGGLRPLELLAELTGLPWWKVRQQITPISTGRDHAESDVPTKVEAEHPPGLTSISGAFCRYLEGRGFNPKQIESLWGIKATGRTGRLSWRIWIPIHFNGRIVSWTTRAIGTAQPRYISAAPEQEAVNHKTLLYGEDLAGPEIVVVEGPLDAWAIGPGAVAIMGLMTTPQQIARIGSHPVRVICCDNEPAAQRRANRLATLVQDYPGETHIVELETGKDPAEAEPDELEEIRRRFLPDWTGYSPRL